MVKVSLAHIFFFLANALTGCEVGRTPNYVSEWLRRPSFKAAPNAKISEFFPQKYTKGQDKRPSFAMSFHRYTNQLPVKRMVWIFFCNMYMPQTTGIWPNF